MKMSKSMKIKLKLKNKQLIIALITFLLISGVLLFKNNFLVIHNKSVSLDARWFVIAKGQMPHRGQIFAFKAKENPAYKKGEIFIKIVGGVGGDELWKVNRNFYINDKLIGTAKTESSKGLPLEMSDAGVIPEHFFFAYTTHKDSYDSRYKEIGLINEKDIIGTAVFAF